MKRTLNKFLALGTGIGASSYIDDKVRFANATALVVGLTLLVPLSIFTLVFCASMVWYPIFSILACVIGVGLNARCMNILGRFMIALVPISLASIYRHATYSQEMDELSGIALGEFSFGMLSYVIFDFRERNKIIIMSVICMLLVISHSFVGGYFGWEVVLDKLGSSLLDNLFAAYGIIGGMIVIVVLVKGARLAEETSEQLLSEATENRQRIRTSDLQIKDNLAKVKEAQANESKQQWVSLGLAEISKTLRNHDNLKELCDNLLKYMVVYLGTNQGAMFLNEETDDESKPENIDMIASYA